MSMDDTVSGRGVSLTQNRVDPAIPILIETPPVSTIWKICPYQPIGTIQGFQARSFSVPVPCSQCRI